MCIKNELGHFPKLSTLELRQSKKDFLNSRSLKIENIITMHQQLETEQKALEINLDSAVYGSFAEIGAGQEVARHFFAVGAAAGTIAKTISAYDKVVSDEIYGREPSGRYVCESRL